MTQKEIEILKKYVPDKAVKDVAKLIHDHNIYITITKNRSSKLGDYRPPVRKPYHRITVNHNLNQYSFLITFIHEVAHLRVWEKYKNKVSSPHGIEWVTEYRNLMNEFLKKDVFPNDLKPEISKSLINGKASSTSDLNLFRALKKYDNKPERDDIVDLETLPEGQLFITKNGGLFKKGGKRRVRYTCFNLNNKKWYLFHPLTPVAPYNEPE